MPYDTVPGSTDPTTLDGGVYSPVPNDPAILIETNIAGNVAAAAASAASAATSAAAALASQNAANASAIAAAASEAAASASASSASSSASTASTSATSAAGSAAAASTSASNASSSASSATSSASAAATSASNASTSASAASSSASAAAASAAAALTSENNAAASFVAMDQKYLGAKASNPTVNNQGGALAAGMLYFNTGSNGLRMYTGSVWISVPGVLSFNTRTGAVTLTSSDVTTALGFTPVDGSAYLLKAGGTMSGALLGVAGAVGTPGFAFSGDANNGWWSPAADQQAWSTAGAERMRIGSTGQITQNATAVGIAGNANTALTLAMGTGAYLSAKGSGGQEMIAGADASGVVLGSYSNHGFYLRTNNTDRMAVDTSGNFSFGVGSTTSNRVLIRHSGAVASPEGASGLYINTGTGAGTAGLLLGTDQTNNVAFIQSVEPGVSYSSKTLSINPQGGNVILGASVASNLGINTVPSNPLHLNASSGNALMRFSDSTPRTLGFLGSGSGIISSAAAADLGLRAEANLVFASAGNNERMRIDTSGNVGIGITASGTQLHVKSASVNIAKFETTTARGSGAAVLGIYDPSGSKGYFGYGSANDNIQISNQLNGAMEFYTNAALRMQITAAGVIQDAAGLELGFKGLPSASVTTGAFVAADRGKCVYATGGVTVPNSTMAQGDVVVIQNTTGSSITITASIGTLRQTGTANTGNRTLLAYGRCAILFSSSTVGFISGDVT